MKFEELPVEVQVAIITAAGSLAATKIRTTGSDYYPSYNFFRIEYKRIMEELYGTEEKNDQ